MEDAALTGIGCSNSNIRFENVHFRAALFIQIPNQTSVGVYQKIGLESMSFDETLFCNSAWGNEMISFYTIIGNHKFHWLGHRLFIIRII